MPSVYCFTGRPGAGKSSACSVAESLNLPVVGMGDVVRERARVALGEHATSSAIGEWATDHRAECGQAVFAEYTADRIEEHHRDEKAVIIDGLRTPGEVDVFEDRFDDVTVVLVTAPFETRLDRLQTRGRDGEDAFTAEDLEERDAREEAWGLGALIEKGVHDDVVVNDGTVDEFEREIEAILNLTTADSS